MADQIGQAGSALNLRLGQIPSTLNPNYFAEFQQIYNALHILGQYMDVLRENLESAPGQTPSESLRFRRTFWAPALQTITTGSVVSQATGGMLNGVGVTSVKINPNIYIDETVGGTGTRASWGLNALSFGIALSDAAPGELVNVGIGPGITQVTNAKCGQLIWGVAALSINCRRAANTAGNYYTGGTRSNNGGVYLSNITTKSYFTGGYSNYEGYSNPGFPTNSGGFYLSSINYLYPIGVCISDGYVLFHDYTRSDSLPSVVIT